MRPRAKITRISWRGKYGHEGCAPVLHLSYLCHYLLRGSVPRQLEVPDGRSTRQTRTSAMKTPPPQAPSPPGFTQVSSQSRLVLECWQRCLSDVSGQSRNYSPNPPETTHASHARQPLNVGPASRSCWSSRRAISRSRSRRRVSSKLARPVDGLDLGEAV